jgi:arsenate reductase-like glutaredoxin family protein
VSSRRDFFRERFSIGELRELLSAARVDPKDVLSKRSKAYRERQECIDGLSGDELIQAMVEEPTLLRRPLVVAGGTLVAGFDRSALESLVGRVEPESE